MSDEGGGTPVASWCLAEHSTVGTFMHGRCDIIPGEEEKTNCVVHSFISQGVCFTSTLSLLSWPI